ncbi:MAG: putative Ig domain-containing protein, partial [Akkermansiaceae bacterium]|nr:putative Ig domain-containing protein [Akkermansiaceae bacterium]
MNLLRPLIALCVLGLCYLLFQRGTPATPQSDTSELTVLHSPDTSQIAAAAGVTISAQNPQTKPDLILPPLDHQTLLQDARKLERQGRYRFAKARKTNIAPHLGGRWNIQGDQAHWQYHLRSVGANSLNLGFSEFHLPPTATLTISDPTGQSQPVTFTSRDNDAHGQLWTPIFKTDELIVRLDLPVSLTQDFRLRLSKTNHGFRSKASRKARKAIGDSTSGSCNIDVVCSAADDPNFGPFVDLYRDQIRSAAAYTLNGVETCSGALINNTRNDLAPYFLTANHCGINSSNASSIVVYWNFENSICRIPNSSNSGANGNGPITQFNSGSIFRATRSASDFCLIELDDPVDPSVNPFYAGWDRSGDNPAATVGIHHPGVSEKRIAFDFDPSTTTDYYGDTSDPNATHVRVADWDFGTTEGGSSGSPLFDGTGRIIGQLHGGDAACGNDLPDWYGRLSRSWSDGGTPSTQLTNWLDPDNTGALTIEGTNSDEVLTVGDATLTEGNAASSTIEVTVTLSQATTETVSVTLRSQEDSATTDDFSPIDQRITFAPNETNQTVLLTIVGDTLPEENESFLLVLSDASNASASSQPGRVTILNDDFITPSINSPLTAEAFANSTFEYRLSALNTPSSFSLAEAPGDMSIDSLTGVLTWTPSAVGSETVTLIATNPAGSDSRTLTLTVSPNSLAAALDLSGAITLSNAAPGWFRQTLTTFDGIDAAQSDPINDDQNANFSIEITGPELLEYQYKVSSEEDFDFLTVSIDGQEEASFSGELAWQAGNLPIPPGSHTVTFSYIKDSSIAEGADTAWLDSFTLAGTTGRPAITSPSSITLDAGNDLIYLIESIAPDAIFSISALPSGLQFDGDRTISGNLTTPGDYTFEVIAMANEQEERLTVTLRVSSPVGDSVELTNLLWTREGESLWFGQSLETFDGIDAAQSGNIDNSESSTMSITVTGPDRLSFQWKVSSEAEYDELAFLLDGQPVDDIPPISGEQDWAQINFTIPSSTHVLSWQYAKDESDNTGMDAAWLDDLRLANGGRPMIWADEKNIIISEVVSRIPLEFINADSFSFQNLPAWLSYDEETNELVGTAPTGGEFEVVSTASGGGESTTRTIRLMSGGSSSLLAELLGQPALSVVTTGDASWIADSTTDPTITRSGQITDGESSDMTILVQGPGTLSFQWKVSSEEDFDFLQYSLNGNFGAEISGDVDWEELEIPLQPGQNTLTWSYQKDGSDFDGEDRGLVRGVTLGGYARFLSDEEIGHYDTQPSDDPDGNGLSLLHEYAFRITPGAPDHPALLTLARLPDQPAQATLQFDALSPLGGMD